MSLFYQFILTLLLGLAAQWLLPWWWILAPVAFLIGLFFHKERSWISFLIGFFSGALLWWGVTYYLTTVNLDILAARMGQLFGGLSPLGMTLLTGLIGGLLGGLGAWSANLGRKMLVKEAT